MNFTDATKVPDAVVVFSIGDEKYCIDVKEVHAIIDTSEIPATKYSLSPSGIKYIDYEDMHIRIINFKKATPNKYEKSWRNGKIIITEKGGNYFGFIADKIFEYVSISTGNEPEFHTEEEELSGTIGILEVNSLKLKLISFGKLITAGHKAA